MRDFLPRFPRPWLALLLACCLALLAACGGGGDDDPAPGPTTGSLAVSIGGLPAGVAGAITVTGPASYSKTLTASTTLTDLVPGAYTLNAASVAQGTGTLAPTPVTQQVQVNAGATASAGIQYAAATPLALGSLVESVEGLAPDAKKLALARPSTSKFPAPR